MTKKIKTLEQLLQAARDRKSICCPKSKTYWGPMPAAFAVNFPGCRLAPMFELGIYIYKAEVKRSKPSTKTKKETTDYAP